MYTPDPDDTSSTSSGPPPIPTTTLFSLDDGLTPPSGSSSSTSSHKSSSSPLNTILQKKKSWETADSASFISDRGTSLTSMSELTSPPPPPPPLKQNKCSHDRNVNFGLVDIRVYGRIMSDNPSVSSGPPVGLDWTYEVNETLGARKAAARSEATRCVTSVLIPYMYMYS